MYYILVMFEIYIVFYCSGLMNCYLLSWWCFILLLNHSHDSFYFNWNDMLDDKFYIIWLYYQKWIIQILNKWNICCSKVYMVTL